MTEIPPPTPAPHSATPEPGVDPAAASSASATSASEDALAALQAEIAALQAKNTELLDQHLRARAEADNARRRAEEEIAKARRFAVEAFAQSLLPVTDSLEAGLAIADASAAQVREGAQATLRQLLSALERNKVLPIAPEPGARFDPHLHQAISVVAVPQEPGTVAGVLQKGYTIAERVLRPALVTVAAAAAEKSA